MEEDQCDDEKVNKIKSIIKREIEKEIVSKQDEVMEITEKIEKALRNLDILKYVVTVNYYENNPTLTSKKVGDQEEESKNDKAQTQIHPCVKNLLPFHSNFVKSFGDGNHSYETRKNAKNSPSGTTEQTAANDNLVDTSNDVSSNSSSGLNSIKNECSTSNTQMPHYIPPLPNPDIVQTVINSPRGGNSRVQHRIIIGNISKWIPPDTREDNSTHKWMVYIRNQNQEVDFMHLVRKVRYFLHESYKPHDIIDVTSAPFHLTRRGWGEFPIRVQLHFHHPLNKPVDIIHNLKLDMTCSRQQTLGAETVVELCLHQGNTPSDAQSKNKKTTTENDYANGKKTKERGDIFDGNLITPLNGINSERIKNRLIKTEEQKQSSNDMDTSLGDEKSENSEITKSLPIKNTNNLILDRRKLQEIIEREHDYIKNENYSGDGSVDAPRNSLLKLFNGKTTDNSSVCKNGTVFDSVKTMSKKNQNPNRFEISLSKGENEIFRNLKSMVNKMEGESQSKYSMKVFKHSYLVNILQRVHATRLKTVESLINWLFRRWPIITKLALDPTYKHVHPYSCPSEEEFFQYNIGKQRSAEWFRAKAIQKILISLKPIIPIEEEIWSTKQIMMWSRFHGYSPTSFPKFMGEEPRREGSECSSNKRLKSNESSSDTDNDSCDYAAKKGKTNGGQFVNGLNVLEKKKNFKKGRKKLSTDDSAFQAKSYRHVSTYSDSSDVSRYGSLEYRVLLSEISPEIDVVNVEENEMSVSKCETESDQKTESSFTVITAPPEEVRMNKFVCEATRQIGIKLTNEEISPGVKCDSVVRVLSQTALSFLDELLRKSLAQAWLRNGDRAPSSLEYDDILATLLEHPQFDLFTNRGLGIQPTIKTEN